jgi:hypothetical protein
MPVCVAVQPLGERGIALTVSRYLVAAFISAVTTWQPASCAVTGSCAVTHGSRPAGKPAGCASPA